MPTSELIIVTSTRYAAARPDEELRGMLAVRGAKRAAELGIPVIAVDGGSAEFFVTELRRAGVTIIEDSTLSMGAARRRAILKALETPAQYLLYTEIEKLPLLDHLAALLAPLRTGVARFVVPRRQSLSSLPSVQQLAEHQGNEFWQMLTGQGLDVWFGPRLWHRDESRYFLDYDGRYGDRWESIFIPLLDAAIDGRSIVDLPIDYQHPTEQTALEDEALEYYQKRLDQLHFLRECLQQHWARRKDSPPAAPHS